MDDPRKNNSILSTYSLPKMEASRISSYSLCIFSLLISLNVFPTPSSRFTWQPIPTMVLSEESLPLRTQLKTSYSSSLHLFSPVRLSLKNVFPVAPILVRNLQMLWCQVIRTLNYMYSAKLLSSDLPLDPIFIGTIVLILLKQHIFIYIQTLKTPDYRRKRHPSRRIMRHE